MNKLKLTALIAAVLLMCGSFSACGNSDSQAQLSSLGQTDTAVTESEKETLSIVCTIFPQYDWIRQITGETAAHIELTFLLDNGVDLHSYQPTTDDIITISNCDMFIYTGGESETWVSDVLKTAVNENMVVINLLEVLGDDVKVEELKEGMEHDHDHEDHDHEQEQDDHEKEDHEDHDHEQEDIDHDHEEQDHIQDDLNQKESIHQEESIHQDEDYDEHIWLSLKNAGIICKHIAEKLVEMDPANSQTYQDNLAAYLTDLDLLDGKYREVTDNAVCKVLLFGDRFPFRYLADDYGLDYYAAFTGCSAETEASFETIVFLAGKTDELKLAYIMVIDHSDQSVAKTIVQSTKEMNQEIYVLDSLQSVTASDVDSGVTYLSIMEKNLEVLKIVLN